jgi:hypothetical protein
VREQSTGASASDRSTVDGSEVRRLILGAAILSILASLAFRGWVLLTGWFYLDDYNLLSEAVAEPLSLDHLVTPYNNHLMPGGRLLTWWVASSGPLDWTLAALLVLGLQLAASAAALWMLLTVFGARWSVLALLNLYLWSAVTLPATVWWAAAINQVPLQLAFFLAVGAWVRYLRTRRLRWLAATAGALALGAFFYVKWLLILGVLLFLLLAYFVGGTPRERVVTAVRTYWPAALVLGGLGGAYLAYYLVNVPQPFSETDSSLSGQIADTMVGTAFATGAVGGPWRWTALTSPAAYADPPLWAQHAAWVVLVLVVLYAALRRTGTLRAWLLLAAYLAALWGLLLNSRAPKFGETIGLEYRYQTEVVCVLVLCLGLALLPLDGAVDGSRPRVRPPLTWAAPAWLVTAAVVAVSASSLFSSWKYADLWRTNNDSAPYLANLAADLQEQGAVELAEQVVPEGVMSSLAAPRNKTTLLAPLVSDRVSFPDSSSDLGVVAPDGTLARAQIQVAVLSEPGRKEDCGWLVQERGRSIPLGGEAFDWTWWVRIGYLASEGSPVVVTAGEDAVETVVQPGLNSLYVKVDGSFDSVRIDGLTGDAKMCVDMIEVGQPVPGLRFE